LLFDGGPVKECLTSQPGFVLNNAIPENELVDFFSGKRERFCQLD
jgi:hypothetical protein